MQCNIELRQKQFIAAMALYENKPIYQLFGKGISVINISLQLLLLYKVLPLHIGVLWQVFSLIVAYYLTDFVNGLVHMYMDNNDNYHTLAGPLIASFHLHHRTPLYKKNPLLIVYFNESGSKIWLAGFLAVTVITMTFVPVNSVLSYILLYFCFLSSIAEISHYLCHVSNSKFVDFLRKIGLLLGKRHHGRHHIEDNINYAFFNGISDPVINLLASKFYPGYKNTTDQHYANYIGKDTNNR